MNSSHFLFAGLLVLTMGGGALVFYAGFRVGIGSAVDRRLTALLDGALDPGETTGALPSQLDDEDEDEPDVWVDVPDDAPPYEDPPTLREVPAVKTAVGQSSGPRHARHDSPSVARKAHAGREQARQAIDARSPWTQPPSWPSDMDPEERESIVEDQQHKHREDAATWTEIR